MGAGDVPKGQEHENADSRCPVTPGQWTESRYSALKKGMIPCSCKTGRAQGYRWDGGEGTAPTTAPEELVTRLLPLISQKTQVWA